MKTIIMGNMKQTLFKKIGTGHIDCNDDAILECHHPWDIPQT